MKKIIAALVTALVVASPTAAYADLGPSSVFNAKASGTFTRLNQHESGFSVTAKKPVSYIKATAQIQVLRTYYVRTLVRRTWPRKPTYTTTTQRRWVNLGAPVSKNWIGPIPTGTTFSAPITRRQQDEGTKVRLKVRVEGRGMDGSYSVRNIYGLTMPTNY